MTRTEYRSQGEATAGAENVTLMPLDRSSFAFSLLPASATDPKLAIKNEGRRPETLRGRAASAPPRPFDRRRRLHSSSLFLSAPLLQPRLDMSWWPTSLVFSTVNGLDISLDYCLPPDASPSSPAPILVWWHGGGTSSPPQASSSSLSSSQVSCKAPARVSVCPPQSVSN